MALHYNRTKGECCPLDEFIQKAKQVHGEKYIYDKTNYIRSSDNVKITCLQHGDFEMTPNNHLSGRGCRGCSKIKLRLERQKPLTVFLEEANNIHNNKYDYSQVNYINCDTKIEIICPIHGSFLQTPWNHLKRKSGCGHCSLANRTGEKHPNWNHNLTDAERELKRRTMIKGYSLWRKSVLKRDNFTCQLSGRKKNLQVHHLDGWSSNKSKRLDISNAITLHYDIHKAFHSLYGNKNNTEGQFREFKGKIV